MPLRRVAASLSGGVAIPAQQYGGMQNAGVRARIDERRKDEATVVPAAMGLTVSDAFRILLTRFAHEKALPFEPLVPNAEIIAAMQEARDGNLPSFSTVDELMADLNAKD